MAVATRTKQRWDTVTYHRIVAASYEAGVVTVCFENGDEARVPVQDLLGDDSVTPDWPRMVADEFHLVVPSPGGDVEIPWDVIRVHSDPEYDAFWARIVAEQSGESSPAAVDV